MSTLKRFKIYLSAFLTLAVLITSIPLQTFAMPIKPSSNSTGKIPTAAEKIPKIKNLLPKSNGTPVELKVRRTSHSKEFINPDGTFTVEIASKPMFFKDKKGLWTEIDNELIPTNEIEYDYVNKFNAFEVFFANNNTSGNLVRFKLDNDHWITFSPVDKFSKHGIVDKAKMEYKNIKSGVDLNYILDQDRLKEEIILSQYPDTNTFSFDFNSKGLIYEKDDEGIIWFKDEKTGEKLFYFAKPFAQDSNEAVNQQVSLDIQNGERLVLTVDDTWLKNAKYPVIIDPTIETSIQPGSADSKDTFVSSVNPTTSYYTNSYLHVGNHWTYGTTRSFIKFNYLPSLPPSAKIVNAYLGAYMYLAVTPDSTVIDVHQITSNWVSSTTTWDNQPTFNTTPESSITSTENKEWQFDITTLAKKWYSVDRAALGSASNYGVMLKANNESSPRRSFYSGDYSSSQPRLIIKYEIDPMGIEPFWTFDGNVNVFSGNLVVSDTDVVLPGKGVPITVTRTYNGRATSPSGHPFGYGWTYNVSMYINYAADEGVVMFANGDGNKHYFVKAKDGSYISPAGVYLTLTKESSVFVLIDKSGTKYYFDSSGKLDKIVDNNGLTTDVSYNTDGTLYRMTDATSRYIAFNYTNGKLTSITGAQIPTVEYGYDGFGNLTSVTKKDASNNILDQVSYGYDAYSNMTSFTDGENNTTTIHYLWSEVLGDRVDYVLKKLTINGVLTDLKTIYSYQMNTNDVYTWVQDPKGNITKYTTNSLGNVEEVIKDEGTGKLNLKTQYSWDQYQNLVEIKDPKEVDAGQNGYRLFYNKGDVVRVVTPDDKVSVYKYDSNSDITQAINTAGHITKYTYDTNRNLINSYNSSFASSVYQYDTTNWNVSGETNPLGIEDNLLPNTTFEKWSNGLPEKWVKVGSGGTVSDDTSTKQNGSHSVKLVSTDSTDNTKAKIMTSDYMPVTSNSKYNLSWYVKTSEVGTTGGGATANVYWYDANHTQMNPWLNSAPATGTTDWMRKGARVDAPVGAEYAKIEFVVNDAGTAWFDNVQLEYGSVINNYNLADNEGFEADEDIDGEPDFWYMGTLGTGDGITTTEHHNCAKSIVVNGDSTDKVFSYELDLGGKAGTPIYFSGWSKAQGVLSTGGAYEALLRVDYSDGTIGWYSTSFNKSTHDWEFVEDVVAAPKDFKSFGIYGKLENQAGQVWFDDYTVRLAGAPNALMSPYNILQNSGFEYANTSGDWADTWVKTAQYSADESKMSWENSLSLSNTESKMIKISDVSGWAVVDNAISEPIKTGKTYTASVAIKTENVSGGSQNSGAVVKFQILDSNGAYLGQKFSKPLTGTTKDWTVVDVTLSEAEAKAINQNAANLRVSFGAIAATSGTMYFDTIRMFEGDAETNYSYTSDGNYINNITNQLGDSISVNPDSRGNTNTLTDPLNHTSNFDYNLLDQLKIADNANNLRTEFTYDGNGNIEQVVNKNKSTGTTLNSTSTQYNELGLVKSTTDPMNRTTYFEYDKNANITKASYPNGKEVLFTNYDAANRVNNISYTGDSTTWAFQYDKNSNITSVTKNGTQTTSFTYDNRDNVTRIDYPATGGSSHYTEYVYNSIGQVLSIKNSPISTTDPAMRYEYDRNGLNSSTYGPNNSYIAYMHDTEGRIKKSYMDDGNTHYLTYRVYNTAGQIQRLRMENTQGASVSDFYYEYDQNGNRTKETNFIDKSYVTYTYDSINQLTEEQYYNSLGTLTKQITYEYDIQNGGLLGNRTKKITTEGGTTTDTYTYNAANEFTNINGTNYTFDANGNLTQGSRTYIYNAQNQLIEVKNGSTTIAQYEYNERGLRSKKVANGVTELYYYNGSELAYITDGNNNKKFYFTRDVAGSLLNMIDYTGATPSTYWYVYDGHGNVVGLVDKNGVKVVSYKYDAFGAIIEETGTTYIGNGQQLLKDANPFRYTAYQYDEETGFYYLKSRYYIPFHGRFMTKDSVDSNNLYVYCENNPVNKIDPDGNIASILFSKTRDSQGDSGLRDIPDDEIARRARDKSLSGEERRRYQAEEKYRGNRNKQKREDRIRKIETEPASSSSSLVDKIGKATGLTGTALVIYIIISEGSRLFPPRNFVPVP